MSVFGCIRVYIWFQHGSFSRCHRQRRLTTDLQWILQSSVPIPRGVYIIMYFWCGRRNPIWWTLNYVEVVTRFGAENGRKVEESKSLPAMNGCIEHHMYTTLVITVKISVFEWGDSGENGFALRRSHDCQRFRIKMEIHSIKSDIVVDEWRGRATYRKCFKIMPFHYN